MTNIRYACTMILSMHHTGQCNAVHIMQCTVADTQTVREQMLASVVAGRLTMPDLFSLPKIACKITNGYYLWQCDYELRLKYEIPVMNKAIDKDTPVSYHFISSAVATLID